jgi:hypothetical protein
MDMATIDNTHEGGRRWYHLRPQPRRRTDLMGVSSTVWMALGWILIIALALLPYPWW